MNTTHDSLAKLVSLIDQDLGDVPDVEVGESAQIVRVTRNGEVALRSLDGQHPFDALVGFVCPADWEVFGVIAPGWGTSPALGRVRTRVIFMRQRDGESASLIRFAGGEAQNMGETPIGRVADCISRAMDLPTEAESDDTLLAMWWDRTLKHVASLFRPVHEAAAAVTLAESLRPTSWADERWHAVLGDSRLMDGSMAAWMDDGMFARAMLAEMEDPETLILAAKRNCSPEAWHALLSHFAKATLGGEA
ncbi:MAG: hypothetical protein V4510_13135 [bacterium]